MPTPRPFPRCTAQMHAPHPFPKSMSQIHDPFATSMRQIYSVDPLSRYIVKIPHPSDPFPRFLRFPRSIPQTHSKDQVARSRVHILFTTCIRHIHSPDRLPRSCSHINFPDSCNRSIAQCVPDRSLRLDKQTRNRTDRLEQHTYQCKFFIQSEMNSIIIMKRAALEQHASTTLTESIQ